MLQNDEDDGNVQTHLVNEKRRERQQLSLALMKSRQSTMPEPTSIRSYEDLDPLVELQHHVANRNAEMHRGQNFDDESRQQRFRVKPSEESIENRQQSFRGKPYEESRDNRRQSFVPSYDEDDENLYDRQDSFGQSAQFDNKRRRSPNNFGQAYSGGVLNNQDRQLSFDESDTMADSFKRRDGGNKLGVDSEPRIDYVESAEESEMRRTIEDTARNFDIPHQHGVYHRENRLEYQIHGHKGPHSYKYGYDTGNGYNRTFRFEERDSHGHVRGRYGFYDEYGKIQAIDYSADPHTGYHVNN